MTNFKIVLIITICLSFPLFNLYGQDEFANTLFYSDSIGAYKADLSKIKWIVGSWKGDAFNNKIEESWLPASGGSMMGMYKLYSEDQVKLYEFMVITEENESLTLKLKHFDSELKGWENKDKYIEFKLVKIMGNRVYFNAYTFEKISDNEINIYVVISRNGKKEEMKFNYKKII